MSVVGGSVRRLWTLLRSPAYSLQSDPDYFAGGRFDAAVLERVRLRIHAVEIKWHTKNFGIVRTAALGTELQPMVSGYIGAAARVELAFAASRGSFVLQRAFNAAVVLHPANAQTGDA
jgi:hypothetical protein